MEVWKDIEGYEGLYQVSSLGRIKSLPGRSNHKSEKILKQATVLGYSHITLSKDNVQKIFKVHRLVASAFIPNPKDLPQVNHIDGKKLNNCVENLEWVNPRDNSLHAFRMGLRHSQKGEENRRSIKVSQFNLDGEWLKDYDGFREAERLTGVGHYYIGRCCKGKAKTAGGFKWAYKI